MTLEREKKTMYLGSSVLNPLSSVKSNLEKTILPSALKTGLAGFAPTLAAAWAILFPKSEIKTERQIRQDII